MFLLYSLAHLFELSRHILLQLLSDFFKDFRGRSLPPKMYCLPPETAFHLIVPEHLISLFPAVSVESLKNFCIIFSFFSRRLPKCSRRNEHSAHHGDLKLYLLDPLFLRHIHFDFLFLFHFAHPFWLLLPCSTYGGCSISTCFTRTLTV